MEIIGSFIDQDWESLSQIFANDENPDFLLHCNGSTLFSSNLQIPPASYFHFDQAFSANFSCSSHESSNEIDEALFLNVQDHEDQQQLLDSANDHTTFESFISNDGFMLPVCNPHDVMEEFLHLKDENRVMETDDSGQEMRLKRKPETPFFQIHEDESHESEDFSTQNPKKKQRISRNAHKSRATQKKKSKKTIQDRISEEEEEGINGEGNSSEDDSNASHLMNASNPKTRASRGSATDPQSLYARKRRERINERLKILQNLVPNGTKVDISTMLEEAVQYVKFLQLQIKLLSSDNLWMYAPLAYNGMDISIYQNISPNLRP